MAIFFKKYCQMIRFCFVYSKNDHRSYRPISDTHITRNAIIEQTEIILTGAYLLVNATHARHVAYVTLSILYIHMINRMLILEAYIWHA